MAKRKNPLLAAILSLLVAGFGQLYLKKFLSGAIFISLEIITSAVFFYINQETGAILNIAVSVLAAYDAYKTAAKINTEMPELREEGNDDIPKVYME